MDAKNPEDRQGMAMRGGQGKGVSNTTALTAYKPRENGGAVVPPMVDAATYAFSNAMAGKVSFAHAYGLTDVLDEIDPKREIKPELIYGRLGTPSITATEAMMQKLEPGSDWAFLFPSGMGAITALVHATCHQPLGNGPLSNRKRDVILYAAPIYGGTHALMDNFARRWGFTTEVVNMNDMNALSGVLKAHQDRVGLVMCETPANPTMNMVDIKAIANLLNEMHTEDEKPVFAVDNTFAGIFQHPLELGTDVVIYSGTKYLGGHSDMIAGFLVGKTGQNQCAVKPFGKDAVKVPLKSAAGGMRTIMGWVPSSEMAHKLGMHMQTYRMRMERQAWVATVVAAHLNEHEKVKEVFFPTLLRGKNKELYDRQMSGPSGMIAFTLKDPSEAAAYRFLDKLEQFLLAVSLGSVRSLAEHPASMTHSDIMPEEQLKMGITTDMLRLSIGIEEPDDLIKDLEQALVAV